MLSGRRTLSEIKFRGRWQADASLKRYCKAAHLQAALGKVPEKVFKFGTLVLTNFTGHLVNPVQLRAFSLT